jgi:acetyl-CoA decarbonylase/synthase, CODH/ACS complex subunit gamma
MALSGIQIYKMLPQTNCKECGFPTCLAFAMKLAAKQVELAACPYVSEESKAQLAESAAPPIRLVTLKSDGFEVKAGNEVVLFRHEKTFYNKPGIFIKVHADAGLAEIKEQVKAGQRLQHELRGRGVIPGWICGGKPAPATRRHLWPRYRR